MHGVEDAPLHGFEAIAGVGERARHNHAHGVIEVRLAHLPVNIDKSNQTNFHLALALSRGSDCVCSVSDYDRGFVVSMQQMFGGG
ncbi:MAG: hypothetical protein Kow00120_02220 [Anaerolineae bacterium]